MHISKSPFPNLVGYTNKELTQGYGVTTFSMMKVGASEFDLYNLTPKSASQWNIDGCVMLSLLDETGYIPYTYTWCDWREFEEDTENYVGWMDNDFAEVVPGEHTFPAGSAFWVQTDTYADIKIVVSGQVEQGDTILTPCVGFGVLGNPYPCEILYSKITPSSASQWNIDGCVMLSIIDETGYIPYTYTWCDWREFEEDTENYVGWMDNDFAEVDEDDFLSANEAVWVQIDTYSDISIRIPAPVLK